MILAKILPQNLKYLILGFKGSKHISTPSIHFLDNYTAQKLIIRRLIKSNETGQKRLAQTIVFVNIIPLYVDYIPPLEGKYSVRAKL